MSKQHFFVRLIPPRPTFPMDMTPEEKSLMQQHVVYTHENFAAGKVLIFGPVMAPTGTFGMAVLKRRTKPRCAAFWKTIRRSRLV